MTSQADIKRRKISGQQIRDIIRRANAEPKRDEKSIRRLEKDRDHLLGALMFFSDLVQMLVEDSRRRL